VGGWPWAAALCGGGSRPDAGKVSEVTWIITHRLSTGRSALLMGWISCWSDCYRSVSLPGTAAGWWTGRLQLHGSLSALLQQMLSDIPLQCWLWGVAEFDSHLQSRPCTTRLFICEDDLLTFSRWNHSWRIKATGKRCRGSQSPQRSVSFQTARLFFWHYSLNWCSLYLREKTWSPNAYSPVTKSPPCFHSRIP